MGITLLDLSKKENLKHYKDLGVFDLSLHWIIDEYFDAPRYSTINIHAIIRGLRRSMVSEMDEEKSEIFLNLTQGEIQALLKINCAKKESGELDDTPWVYDDIETENKFLFIIQNLIEKEAGTIVVDW